MSVARVASVSDGLDAISTSLQLGFPTSHVCCEQVNQNLARSCQIQVEILEKNVDCENEMKLLGFPKILTAGGEHKRHAIQLTLNLFGVPCVHREASASENGTFRRPAMKTLEPLHLQALDTFGHVQSSTILRKQG